METAPVRLSLKYLSSLFPDHGRPGVVDGGQFRIRVLGEEKGLRAPPQRGGGLPTQAWRSSGSAKMLETTLRGVESSSAPKEMLEAPPGGRTRFYLELLLEPGSIPLKVVVVVIFMDKCRRLGGLQRVNDKKLIKNSPVLLLPRRAATGCRLHPTLTNHNEEQIHWFCGASPPDPAHQRSTHAD
ncbi:hypothetical protein F7725_003521, partial [Dissostichus mawsoni]